MNPLLFPLLLGLLCAACYGVAVACIAWRPPVGRWLRAGAKACVRIVVKLTALRIAAALAHADQERRAAAHRARKYRKVIRQRWWGTTTEYHER